MPVLAHGVVLLVQQTGCCAQQVGDSVLVFSQLQIS